MWDYLSNKGVGKPWKSSHHLREEFKKRFLKGAQEMQSGMGSPSTRTRSSFGRGSHSYDPGVA